MITFGIVPGQRRVVELSQQRSGSTLMMSLFSLIDNAFVLPEPHNMFDVNIPLSANMNASAELPSIASLLDCSFIEQGAVRNVFWSYACAHIHWIVKSPAYMAQCRRGTLPLPLLNDKCKQADINLVKIVRLPLLIDAFSKDRVIPKDIKVGHLGSCASVFLIMTMKLSW